MANILWSVLLLISSLVVLQASSSRSSGVTELDDYVNAPDDTYSYKLIYEYEGDGFTTYYLNMTSQKWLTGKELLVCNENVVFYGCGGLLANTNTHVRNNEPLD